MCACAGHSGRIAQKGATLSQYVLQTIARRVPDDRDQDPRAAILRHAQEALENPYWANPAYAQYVFCILFRVIKWWLFIANSDWSPR